MEAAVQWSKIPTLEEKYNSTKLDVKIKSPTVVCLLLIFSQIWLTSVSQTIWRSNSKGIRQIESLSDEPQLSSENWPVLDLILRVGDGWRVPDELEPGGRVGLQLEEVRGRGGSWENISENILISIRLRSQSQHVCPEKYPELSNIWKFNKNPQKFEFEYFNFFPVCVCLYQPWILTPFQADSDILRVSTEEGKEVPFSFLETTKKLYISPFAKSLIFMTGAVELRDWK